MAETLKPCPFCGNPPVERRIVEMYPADADWPAGEYDAHYTIACDDCGIDMGDEYRDEVVANWNRRAKPVLKRVERQPLHIDDDSLPAGGANG